MLISEMDKVRFGWILPRIVRIKNYIKGGDQVRLFKQFTALENRNQRREHKNYKKELSRMESYKNFY
jgi:hypothetical protein